MQPGVMLPGYPGGMVMWPPAVFPMPFPPQFAPGSPPQYPGLPSAAAAGAAAGAAAVWRECDSQGRRYWYNSVTGATTWEEPAAVRALRNPGALAAAPTAPAAAGRPPAAAAAAPPRPEAGWLEYHDEQSGKSYFHHKASGKTVWKVPAEVKALRKQRRELAAAGAAAALVTAATEAHRCRPPAPAPPAPAPPPAPASPPPPEAPDPAPAAPSAAPPPPAAAPAPQANPAAPAAPAPSAAAPAPAAPPPATPPAAAPASPAAAAAAGAAPAVAVRAAGAGSIRGQEKTEERVYAGKAERKEAFIAMLADRALDPDMPWEQAMKIFLSDDRYVALRSKREKEELYKEYCRRTKAQRELASTTRMRKLREDFQQLLQCSLVLTPLTSYAKAEAYLEQDCRWRALEPEDERRRLYEEHIAGLEREERRRKEARRKQCMEDFRALLIERGVASTARWAQVEERLQGDPRAKALDRKDRAEVFDQLVADREREAAERAEQELREEQRALRLQRAAFRELLRAQVAAGLLTHRTRWKAYSYSIRERIEYADIQAQHLGHDMFDAVVGELRAAYLADKRALCRAVLAADLAVTPSDSLRTFRARLRECAEGAAALRECQPLHLRSFFDECLAAAGAARGAAEEEALRALLSECPALAGDDATFAEAERVLGHTAEWAAVAALESGTERLRQLFAATRPPRGGKRPRGESPAGASRKRDRKERKKEKKQRKKEAKRRGKAPEAPGDAAAQGAGSSDDDSVVLLD